MARPLPEHAELFFVEAVATGVVHIEARVPVWARPQPTETIRMGDGSGAMLAAVFETPTVVRCGQRTFPGRPDEDRYRFTTCFRDEQLCGGCYRTLTPADQERAFEHETPDAAGDANDV
jgi:hypothetical protein